MPPRILTRWLVLSMVLLLAFVGTVTTLNLTVYSASGFVASYLDAVARHDVPGARHMPGVTVTALGTDELLAPAALASLTGIRLKTDTDDGGGRHTVTFGYTLGGAPGASSFEVERTGTRFGVFTGWRFVRSPQSVVTVTVRNGTGLDANSIPLPATTPAGNPHAYRVLTPGRVVLSHSSPYLTSARAVALVDRPGSSVTATVDIRANPAFVRDVQKELDAYLATCITQRVLLPTGCPMGVQIADRLQDAPSWSILRDPVVTIVPGSAPGSWQVPKTAALAHLTVRVKSIFDGSLSTFDRDVPFVVHYLITFGRTGAPVITAQY